MTIIKIPATFIVVCWIFFLTACDNYCSNSSNLKENVKNTLYYLPNINNNTILHQVLKASNINRGGYVLIISDKSEESLNSTNKLRNYLYNKQLIAVHSISFNKTIHLLNTEKIAIENSSLIFFIGDFENDKYLMNKKSNLGYFLNKAYTNGTVVAMIGKSAIYCGNRYYLGNNNAVSESDLPHGLNITNFITTFKNNFQLLGKSTTETNILSFNDTTPLLIVNKTKVINISDYSESP